MKSYDVRLKNPLMPHPHVPATGWHSRLQLGLTGAVVTVTTFTNNTSAAGSPSTLPEMSEGLSYLRSSSLGTVKDKGVKKTC